MSGTGAEFVITAAGAISAAGHTPRAIRDALVAKRPVATTPTTPLGDAIAIEGFDPRTYLSRKGLSSMSRPSQLVLAAAAQLSPALASESTEGVGVVVGTTWAALETIVEFERRAHLDGARFVDPLLFTETVANVAAGQVSIQFGWSALNVTLAGDAAAGLTAIEQALALLDDERATTIVAGGVDALHGHQLGLAPLAHRLRHGEGAALIAISSRARAEELGMTAMATIAGLVSCSAVDPISSGAARSRDALTRVLEHAGWSISELDLLVVCGDLGAALWGDDVQGGPRSLFVDQLLGRTWAASIPLGIVAALDAIQCAPTEGPPIRRAAVVLADDEAGFGAVALGAMEVRDGH